jgi:hypothetical protein
LLGSREGTEKSLFAQVFDFVFQVASHWGFRTMTISVPGHADHPFRDDGDHDSGMMPITRSEMMPIS